MQKGDDFMSEELLTLTAEDQLISEQQVEPQADKAFKLATVTELLEDGCAKIKFDEDEEASEKEYAYLSCYSPTVGDRVLIGIVGASYVIIGKINYAIPPEAGNGSPGNLTPADIGAAPAVHTHVWSDITNQPKINNKTLSGNMTLSGLGIAAENHTHSSLKYTRPVYGGTWQVDLTDTSLAPSTNESVPLGEKNRRWGGVYIGGTSSLSGSAYICGTTSDKLVFFNAGLANPPSQQSVSYVSTSSTVTAQAVAQNLFALEAALKRYNLIK